MKQKPIFLVSLTLVSFVLIISFGCNKNASDLASTPVATTYLDLPSSPYHYTIPDSSFDASLSTDNVATLGRVLFYDTHLSINNSMSCGTCHRQGSAFSDNTAFSNGFDNRQTIRNTLPIQNLSTTSMFGTPPTLFWDGRSQFLFSMVLQPIINHVEMGMDDLNSIVTRVKNMPYYKDLFTNAFGSADVDINKIAAALSTFTGSITSGTTRFDYYNQGQVKLSAIELEGFNLFFTKYNCNSCHQTQVLNGYQQGGGFVNIGLDLNYTDNGVGALTKNPADNGKFKIPNLRNVALTAPYMHDGRFATLNDVLDHYSSGIAAHPNLDPRLKDNDGNPIQMNISSQERTAIIAFLNTLTDYNMITDPKFSNPFRTK